MFSSFKSRSDEFVVEVGKFYILFDDAIVIGPEVTTESHFRIYFFNQNVHNSYVLSRNKFSSFIYSLWLYYTDFNLIRLFFSLSLNLNLFSDIFICCCTDPQESARWVFFNNGFYFSDILCSPSHTYLQFEKYLVKLEILDFFHIQFTFHFSSIHWIFSMIMM